MYKEIVISIIIVIVIIIGDTITQKYTKKIVDDLTSKAIEVKESIKNNDNKEIFEKISQVEREIDNTHNNLAYYIEHDELEKVETNFTACKSLIETGNYDLAKSYLEKCVFVLEHIKDKYSFSLENIF